MRPAHYIVSLQALQASLSRSALAEDAAADAKLQEAGQQLDRLADALQALEAKQAALQVSIAAWHSLGLG